MSTTAFILVKHHAKKAGDHFDLRFRIPDSKMWISFATKKEIPLNENSKKIILFRTHDHSESQALTLAKIEKGYGEGTYTKFDSGACDVLKFEPPRHIVVDFKGNKLKGRYHFVSARFIFKNREGNTKFESYLFFKSNK